MRRFVVEHQSITLCSCSNKNPSIKRYLSTSTTSKTRRKVIGDHIKRNNTGLLVQDQIDTENLDEETRKFQHDKKEHSVKQLLEAYATANNIRLGDWYNVSTSNIDKTLKQVLKKEHSGSLIKALLISYPEAQLHPWKFKYHKVPRNYWKDSAHYRLFFDDLGKTLGVEKPDDWYDKLSQSCIIQHGGKTLLQIFNHSPVNALMNAYPEHKWIPWKFNKVSKGIWTSKDNVRQFLNELSEKLSIQTLEDWYRVDKQQLQAFGGDRLRKQYHGLYNILKEQYPHYPWDRRRFLQAAKKSQRYLIITLKKMFPNEDILEDYLHPKVTFSTNRPVQLDVYIPSKSLAFEYQGEQHFDDVQVFNPSRGYQQRDEEKRSLCAANNIKLVEVPYWWNRTQESLQQMINMASQ